MTEHNLAGGNLINELRALDIHNVCQVNSADDLLIAAGNDGWITHAAPGDGLSWVLGSVVVGFDTAPLGAFRLEVWYNIGAGNVVVFNSYVGTATPVGGTDISPVMPIMINWPVSPKFPEDAQMRVTLYSGDAAAAASLNILSWVEAT